MRVGIAADDLTSATDGASPFVLRGRHCAVYFDCCFAPSVLQDIVSINKDSRSRSRDEAARRSAHTARALSGTDILYQTVDSTIRGHLEAEVLAALAASGRKVALFAPAFPQAGRTTVGGEQFVDGKPVTQTSFRVDPIHPVTQQRIRAHFPSIPDRNVQLRAIAEAQDLRPGSLTLDREQLVIADAITQHHLDLLVAAIANPCDVLFCGSPGMARALAKRFAIAATPSVSIPRAALPLAVVGSANVVSNGQKERLLADTNVAQITIDVALAVEAPAAAAREAIANAVSSMAKARALVISICSARKSVRDPTRITEAIGLAAAELMCTLPVDGLILTGGDTAAAVFNAIGIHEMTLSGELEPGISVGRVELPRAMGVITKAGGFGSVDVLVDAVTFLRSGKGLLNEGVR